MSVVALSSAFMVAAGPVVWRLVPPILVAVQFPYRLLAQTTLFGVLALALALQKLDRRWRSTRPRYLLVLAAHLVVLITAIQFAHPLPAAPHPPATLFEEDARIESVLHIDYVQFPDSLVAPMLASSTSGFDPRFLAAEAQLSKRFYGHDDSSADGGIRVQRDQVDFAGSTARTIITAGERHLHVLPAQFSPYLRIIETDAQGHALATIATDNVDGKAAVTLDAGTHRLRLDREMAPFASALSVIGCLSFAVAVLARRRRGTRAMRRGAHVSHGGARKSWRRARYS
jgi:hypothetical protein